MPPRRPRRRPWIPFARLFGLAVLLAGTSVLLAASIAPTATVAAGAVDLIDTEIFDFPPLPDSFSEASVRSVVLARDGTRLAVLHDENRKIVRLEDVPVHVQQAVIATEDDEFWEHRGVNWRAVLRAAVGNVRAGEIRSGASTITQQLVKTLTRESDRTFQRKMQEAYWATELERRMPKEAILEEYLNRAYFGNRVYGIGTAAEFYWGKDVSELDVEEGALLAGMIRAPALNDPIAHPEAAVRRRNIVLSQMAENGFVSDADARRLQALPLALDVHPPSTVEPFFVTYVRGVLAQEPALGPDRESRLDLVHTGGLTIRTSLSPSLNRIADDAIREVLTDPAAPQAALTVVDPQTGDILAVGVGPRPFGDGEGETEVTPALPGLGSPFGRQPGSAFKAFALVGALESGVPPGYTMDTPSPYEPVSLCSDENRKDTEPWRPGNYSDSGSGILDMARATAVSSNVYFAALVDQFVGPHGVVDVARRMGVRHGTLTPVCSAVLGANDVYGLDMASAFGTLANNGVYCEPRAVLEIVDGEERVLLRREPTCERVLNEVVAARTTAFLRGPLERGTASRNGPINRPAAGKTGTTQDYKDAWFVGYVPQLSAAAWVGHEIPAPMTDPRCSGSRVTGGCLPTMIWNRFMSAALAGVHPEEFPPPPPVPTGDVPQVVGRPVEEAMVVLKESKFNPVPQVVPDHRPAGTVIAQDPAGGVEVELGRMVLLTVSDGTAPAPRPPRPTRTESPSDRTGERSGERSRERSRERVRTPPRERDRSGGAEQPTEGTRQQPPPPEQEPNDSNDSRGWGRRPGRDG